MKANKKFTDILPYTLEIAETMRSNRLYPAKRDAQFIEVYGTHTWFVPTVTLGRANIPKQLERYSNIYQAARVLGELLYNGVVFSADDVTFETTIARNLLSKELRDELGQTLKDKIAHFIVALDDAEKLTNSANTPDTPAQDTLTSLALDEY